MGSMGIIFAAAGTGAGALPDPTSYQTLGWLLVAFGALITAMNQAHSFWQRVKDKPTGGEVAMDAAQRFSTKQECAARHAEHEHKFELLQNQIAATREDAINGRRNLHNKMEQANKDTNEAINKLRVELSAELTRVHERVDDLQGEVRAVPATVVRMISEAKKI